MKRYIIDKLAQSNFDDVFVKDALNGKEYTYNTFFGRCFTLASLIKDKAYGKNHLVLLMDNSIELMSCYFTSIILGRIATAIDPLKGEDEIMSIIDEIEDSFIIVDKVGGSKIAKADFVFSSSDFDKLPPMSDDVKQQITNIFEGIDFTKDYLLTFTSGTSGKTKGVRHSLNNLFSTAVAFNKEFGVDCENTFAHVMPMTYMAGILNSIFQPFVAGSSIVVLGRFSPMKAFTFWQDVEKYKVNTFWLSPSMLTILLKVAKHEVGQKYCKEHKTLFFIGTAPLHQSTRVEFEAKYPVKLYASYGLSETLFLSTETPETLALGGGNVGKLLDGVNYRFDNDGEFLVDVPWMYLGYTNEPTENYFEDTSYKTGDLAKIENNILSIVGRKKDLIIKGGMNLSPALIEKVVSEIEGIDECAAFGALNSQKEESVILAYCLQNGYEGLKIEEIIHKSVLGVLGKNYMIDKFYNVSSIPKNINGKIDKNVLKSKWLKENADKV